MIKGLVPPHMLANASKLGSRAGESAATEAGSWVGIAFLAGVAVLFAIMYQDKKRRTVYSGVTAAA